MRNPRGRWLALAVVVVVVIGQGGGLGATPNDDDPFLWLEDVDGAKAMDWVKQRTRRRWPSWASCPCTRPFERTKKILDSKDKIAYPTIMNDQIYNFWKDADHQRGLWRRTTHATI